MKFAAWYSIVVGILMLAQWTVSLASGEVPELQAEPFRIAFHLLGEAVTSIALIFSGISLLRGWRWARDAALASLGMLTYTVLVSPGYFGQQGRWIFVLMFGLLLALTLISFVLLGRSKPRSSGG